VDAVEPQPGPLPPADDRPVEPVEPVERVEAVERAEPAEAVGAVETVESVEVVELALASVELSPEGLEPATGTVSLVVMEGSGQLDIVMARSDALLVQEAIAGTVPARPRTHDLLIAAVDALGGAITGVTLVGRRPGGVYVASLQVSRADGSVAELDARPSDALNVALRSTGPVLRAARSLLDVPAN